MSQSNTIRFAQTPLKRGGGLFRSLHAALNNSKIGELLVLKGIITCSELRQALDEHKSRNIPLGQVLIEHKILSKRTLALILLRQKALRIAAASLLFLPTFGFFPKRADAEIMDVPAKISLASTASFEGLETYPALFGSAEKRSSNLTAFTKWADMFTRFDRALKDSSSKEVITKLKGDLESFKDLSLSAMADKVNTLMNQKRYILDNRNWGKSDYWATPIEFLTNGGDCEDFAIAKYVALRALGVGEERLRIAIVHDKVKNIPHAVLVVYSSEGALILDNQNKEVMTAESLRTRYRPIFSINREFWWLHTAPESTLVASAK